MNNTFPTPNTIIKYKMAVEDTIFPILSSQPAQLVGSSVAAPGSSSSSDSSSRSVYCNCVATVSNCVKLCYSFVKLCYSFSNKFKLEPILN